MTQVARERSIGDSLRFVWLNAWFWTVAPLATLVFAIGATLWVLVFLVVTRNRRRTKRIIRLALAHYGALMFKCPWPLVRVKYVDYAPDEKPPFVFICNHRSTSDGYLVACIPFEAIQVLNIWPTRVPIMGLIANWAGYLSVREMPFEEFLHTGSKLLAEGCSIVAFPEGTRSGSRALGQFHGSTFRLAMHNRVKIVPLVIDGNENIPHRGSAWLNPGRVVVSKLPAVLPERFEGMTPFKLKTMVREIIRQHLETNPA
jgi:1-acyl-sn-glycerol-3-phosphate acyltransferase